ncbi:hypothetical protein EVAR_100496_1 [Eumeta japonica]|uniref:Uncharacterized protein n=1 Tax=Eumeta variegata TaxID=151549 RepID=A0A4C2A0P6_EUMVA|nr:hypothetical protein EVAR_100496_1 [Eumeta japonica]
MAFSTTETGRRTRITIENLNLIEIENENMGKFEYAIKIRIENLPESEQEAVLRLKQDRDREWNRNLFPASESNVAPQSRLEEIDFENGNGTRTTTGWRCGFRLRDGAIHMMKECILCLRERNAERS